MKGFLRYYWWRVSSSAQIWLWVRWDTLRHGRARTVAEASRRTQGRMDKGIVQMLREPSPLLSVLPLEGRKEEKQ